MLFRSHPEFSEHLDLTRISLDRDDVYRILLGAIKKYGVDAATGLMNSLFDSLRKMRLSSVPGINIIRLARPKARITVDAAKDMNTISELDNYFLALFEHRDMDPDVLLGVTIYSSIRYGGLLNSARIMAFIRFLSNEESTVSTFRSSYWIDLGINGIADTQRWKPDPLTAVLLARWLKTDRQAELKSWLKTVGEKSWYRLLKKTGLDVLPMTRLLSGVGAIMSLSIPPSLVDCMSGFHDSRTLSSESFLRLSSGLIPHLRNEDLDSHSDQISMRESYDIPNASVGVLGAMDSKLIRESGVLLRNRKIKPAKTGRGIEALISSYRDDCTPVTIYLTQWVSARMTKSNRWGNRFAKSSAYSRRCAIGRRLRSWLGAKDPLRLSKEELIDIYDEVVDHASSPGLRASISKNLRDFHEYLEDTYGAEPISSDVTWWRSSPSDTDVDASIVLPHEYYEALDYCARQIELPSSSVDRYLWRARRIALILGFRCGLRRKEIHFLRLTDFEMEYGRIELTVRPYADRSLKSSSAYRRLPVDVLLSVEEVDILMGWIDSCRRNNYLFQSFDVCVPFILEGQLFDPLKLILQAVTGNKKARFHHLRHSFATLNFWRWMHKGKDNKYVNNNFNDDGVDINRQKQVVLSLTDGGQPSQKVLHAISMMIGHSGPSITLTHYIHCSDMLFATYHDELIPDLNSSMVAGFCDVSIRQIQNEVSVGENYSDLLEARAFRVLKRYSKETCVEGWRDPDIQYMQIGSNNKPIERLMSLDVWKAVLRSQQGYSVDDLEKMFCVDRTMIQRGINNAKYINNLKYDKRSHKTYRHRPNIKNITKIDHKYFNLPKKFRDYEQAVHMLRIYEGLDNFGKAKVDGAVRYFIQHGRAKEASIDFVNSDQLNKFLPIFDFFDLHSSRGGGKINKNKAVLRSKWKPPSKSYIRVRSYWGKVTALKKFSVSRSHKESHSAENGILSIICVSEAPKAQASWGFRAGLYALALLVDDLQRAPFKLAG